jgi:hypothetical protein
MFNYTAPATSDGAFEIEAVGGFSGDLVHLHQHTGNPGAGTDLLHLESEDPDVLSLRVRGSAPVVSQFSGGAVHLSSNTILTGTTIYQDATASVPVTWLNRGSSASGSTFWRGDGTWATVTASGDNLGNGTGSYGVNTSSGVFDTWVVADDFTAIYGVAGATASFTDSGNFGNNVFVNNAAGGLWLGNLADYSRGLLAVPGGGLALRTNSVDNLQMNQNGAITILSSVTVSGSGGANIAYGVTVGSITVNSGGSSGKSMCWKTATTLGYCSSLVAADGSCTCN